MRWALLLGLAALFAGLGVSTGQRADALGALTLERHTTAESEPAGSFEGSLWSVSTTTRPIELLIQPRRLALRTWLGGVSCTGIRWLELSWVITGGVPPYTLSIDGEPVDPGGRSTGVRCGLLPTDPQPCDPEPKLQQTYRIVATDSRGVSIAAEEQVAVAAPPQRPAPGAVLPGTTAAAVRLGWTAVTEGSAVCAYELRYQVADWDATSWPNSWTVINEAIETGPTEYLHDGLDPDRRYRYQVRARNNIGAGDWSRTFPDAGARPGAPTLAAQTAASGSVALSWTTGSPGATRWEYRQQPENGSWGAWTPIAGSDASTSGHTVTGLTEDARYQFQLRAGGVSGAGPASATASAVAGLTPTEPSDRKPLSYDDLDSAGGAVRSGSYAFLADAGDLTSGVTTFAEMSSAAALLLNTSGYRGRDYAAVLEAAEVGDRITWFSGCWYHYRVTEILADPPARARKLFRIALEAEDPCGFTEAQTVDPNYFNDFRDRVAAFGWDNDPPSEPHIGPDGIRIVPYKYAAEGGHTYRLLGRSRPTSIVIDVPAGMRLIYLGFPHSHGPILATYEDEATGSLLFMSPYTGRHAVYRVKTPEGWVEPPADVAARFEALIASIREQPLPPLQAPGAPRSTSASEGVRLHWTAVTATPAVSAYELQYQATEWDNIDWPDQWTVVGGRIGANETTYLHRDLDPDRRYRYRLRARNSIDLSDWSPVSPAVGAQPLPGAPTLLASTAASGAVALSWITGPSSITKWEYRRQQEGGSWGDWTGIANADASTASHIVSGLTEDVRYSFQLRAVNAAGPGPASAASSAVAGLTPTVPSERETLSYDDLDSDGGAVRPGSYAFLTDADDLTSGATTFAEASSAEALLLNTSGDASRYAHVLATVQAGDRITWFPYSRCWYHYRVTEILADPPALGRKLFRIELEAEDPCSGAADRAGNAKNYFDEFRNNVTSFAWGPPPNEPRVGADGIRIMSTDYPVEGGHTYRLASWTPIVIDVPAGMRLAYVNSALQSDGSLYDMYFDEATGSIFALDPYTGRYAAYEVETPEGETEPPADVVARFEALIASVRKVPLP